MPRDLYIRRDRSALSSGAVFRRQRRRSTRWLLVAVLLALAGAGAIMWQFNAIQPMVLAMVGIAHTPTPTILEAARQGDLAFWRGDLKASVEHYRHAAGLDPNNVDIVYELARMLIYHSYVDERNRSDIEEAVGWSTRLIEVSPRNARAFAIHCYALVRAARSEEAVQSCNRALALMPDYADAQAYLALAYTDLGRIDVASQAARRALELNPNSIEANTAYAFLLTSVRRADAAIEYLKKAASINQRLEFPYYNLAVTALGVALTRDDEAMYLMAVNAYDTVLAMNKRSVKAYTSLCRVYFSKGEPNLARDNCRTAVDVDSTYTPAWRWLGEVSYRSMEYEEAAKAFEQCSRQEQALPPGARQAECWYYLALSYVQMGDCAKAMPVFDDLLAWTGNARAIELANKGIQICASRAPTAPISRS